MSQKAWAIAATILALLMFAIISVCDWLGLLNESNWGDN